MRRTAIWIALIGVLTSLHLASWYVAGLTGSGYAYVAYWLVAAALALAIGVPAHLAKKRRAWRVLASLVLLVLALAVGAAFAGGAGVDAFEAQQTALVNDLRARVDELNREISETTAVEVTDRFPEFGYARAKRTETGQLVVQLDSRLGRRGMVYLSRDDLEDARFPKWFALKRILPNWYIWLGTG